MNKLKVYIKSIILPLAVGGIIGLITSSSIDYNNLQKPPLAPPGYLFPIIWTILFALMGISYGILKNKKLVDEKINPIYYLQLVVNALWSIFFFTFKWRLFSFIWIILLDVLIFIMIIRFFNKDKLAGLLQLPYLLWAIFASYLNLAIYFLN